MKIETLKTKRRKGEEITPHYCISSTNSVMGAERSETHDSSSLYFPGCRKDTNCNCEICLASIEATRDLKRSGAPKISRARVLRPNASPDGATASSDLSAPPTPEILARVVKESPLRSGSPLRSESPLRSTAKSKRAPQGKIEKQQKRQWVSRSSYWKVLVCFGLVLAAEFGYQSLIFGLFRPALSPEFVMKAGEDSALIPNLEGRLAYLQQRIEEIVQAEVSKCGADDSFWELNQDGYLLCSRCILYRSKAEEVSIWGWPLQTAGLLVSSFSSRSFTILSGRITEWPDGGIGLVERNISSSWTQEKWRLSPLQIDPNTWILEYKRAALLQNPSVFSTIIEFLVRKRMWRKIIEHDFLHWAAAAYHRYYTIDVAAEIFVHPT
ncbi:hypothetical protein H6P81_004881 [Aristolochia fimbriata]|uniref:Uncharacterized protein n=1 Tax=Aristolochia fimbriata TaxID=158543 RepID=A0AAV7EWH5_ARIFI|nr:hypothetical protein H6P81_004881 [Aristolochia fimbriata]